MRLGYRGSQQFATDFLAFDRDLVDASDPDKLKRCRQAGFQMVHMCHLPSGAKAYAAPGGEDDRMAWPLCEQGDVGIDWFGFVDLNRPAQTHDLIDPGLERRGHAEVV